MRRAQAWAAVMALLTLTFAAWVLPRLKTETDLLQLLPQSSRDAAANAALSGFSDSLARQLLFLVGAPQFEEAKAAAARFAGSLEQSGAFRRTESTIAATSAERIALIEAHRAYLLSDRQRALLADGTGDALAREALRSAFTPAGLVRLLPFRDDPLGLLADFMRQQMPAVGSAQLDSDVLAIEKPDRSFVLVTAEIAGSAFDGDVQDRVLGAINAATDLARTKTEPGAPVVEVLMSGVVPHAAAARQRAQTELGVFGVVDTLSVVTLILLVLGTWRPLLLATLVLALSSMAAITVCHFVFGRVHLLALVFGSSLIGVVIDYALHFLADRFRDPERWQPIDALRHVGPAILLGLATTLVGYFGLMLMPFPGLRQIAIFCGAGLVVGAGSVLCLFPLLAPRRGRMPQLGPRVGRALDGLLARWRWSAGRIAIFTLIGALLAFGITKLIVHDDIRALQNSKPELAATESRVRDLLGTGNETRFILIQGPSAQAVLESEERLTPALDRLVASHALGSYVAVSRAVPSLRRQQENHRLLAENVYARGGALPKLMTQFGFDAAVIERQLDEFESASAPLSFADWQKSTAAAPYRSLWLGETGPSYASVITLGGIRDLAAVARLDSAEAGVHFVDRVSEISTVLSRYRDATATLLGVAYLVAAILLCLRFGWQRAAAVVLPSFIASALTLGIFGWLGVPVNLFNALALLLVLALGIDYGIFLQHGAASRSTAILSVTLSALTTLLAFGPLGFSATPFIRSIGLTLLVGIGLSWLLVLFSCLTIRQRNVS